MKKLIVVMIILSSVLTGCKLDLSGSFDDWQNREPKLWPETTTGENIISFILNGEVINVTSVLNQNTFYQGGALQFSGLTTGRKTDSVWRSTGFVLVNPDLKTGQRYDLTDETRRYRLKANSYPEEGFPEFFCEYGFDETIEGFVEFTRVDRVKHIVSGRFEFLAVQDQCETVNVTDGRFDLQYTP